MARAGRSDKMRIHFTPWRLTQWRRLFGAIVPATFVLLTAGAVAVAQEQERPRLKDATESQLAVEPRAVAADAPNARLVALVRAPDGALVMSKGVHRVRRIATGVYCIRPQNTTGINPNRAIVVVSVEYFYSLFNEVQVQWARRDNGCNTNEIGVYTQADPNLSGRYVFSNAVGFVVYVP
jgi:hypothetical protein